MAHPGPEHASTQTGRQAAQVHSCQRTPIHSPRATFGSQKSVCFWTVHLFLVTHTHTHKAKYFTLQALHSWLLLQNGGTSPPRPPSLQQHSAGPDDGVLPRAGPALSPTGPTSALPSLACQAPSPTAELLCSPCTPTSREHTHPGPQAHRSKPHSVQRTPRCRGAHTLWCVYTHTRF